MSDAILRPGLALGPYPERLEPRPGVLERAAARVTGFLTQHAGAGPRRLGKLVPAVEVHGRALRAASDARLGEEAQELRVALRTRGLRDELVARSFALVRECAGRALGMRHHDSQLAGGWAMIHGKLAEMETGEGKTLTATLPACTAALAGIPVHVITVNDYLVTRDVAWMGPVYEMLGLSTGAVTEELDAPARRAAYARDVTYCSNKQVAFDYLKDRIVLGNTPGPLRLELEHIYSDDPRLARLLLRGLCFAIVDEADSVLIDEARTPLIISREGTVRDQRRVYDEALAVAGALDMGADFLVETRERRIELTERGRRRVEERTRALGGLWRGRRRREELITQALTAERLYERDRHYLLRDGKVQIIDEFTGRVMADRSWERGLHQMIEAKEGCELTSQKETLARISYQRFFRRYLRLAGMTGTAREVAAELWSVYRLEVVTIAPNRPVRRVRRAARLFSSDESKHAAVVETIRELHAVDRPVLVGTRSVGASETLSELLAAAALPHRVLNARQDQEEAEVIEAAGEPGRITVATNMAGRGTDIRLAPGVVELGGLHVIATEGHEARRIDRQLFGRCGRQGDPGSFEIMLSLDDELFTTYAPGVLTWLARMLAGGRRPAGDTLSRMLARSAQRRAEHRHSVARRELLRIDERIGDALAFSGRAE